MSAFIRRFLTDPGNAVLLQIESVNILDLDPPQSITGVGSGVAQLVGEFEDGPFNTPYQLGSAGDFLNTFGDFGYTYLGVHGNNPCARARKADSAIVAENWNGNGFIQLSGKTFASLIACRVDTSVGSVQFTRLASLRGLPKFAYTLTSGQTLLINIGAGNVTATFTAAVATVTGSAGVFTTIAAGDTVTLAYDGNTFTTTFLATDVTNTLIAARINIYAGFTFVDVNAGQLRLTGRKAGTGGSVQVVSGSTGVLTKLGLTAATTNGTGNVADILNVALTEANTIVAAAVTGAAIDTLADGTPRLVNNATPGTGTIIVDPASTALDFGFPLGVSSSAALGNVGTIPAGTRVSNTGLTTHLVTMQTIAVTAASAGPYSVKVRHATDDGTGTSLSAGALAKVEVPVDLDAYTCINPLPTTAALTEAAIDVAYGVALTATLDLNSVSKTTNMSWSARQSNTVRRSLRQNALDASANGLQGRVVCIRPPLGTTKAVAKGSAEPGVAPYRDQRVIYNYPGVRTNVPRIAALGTAGGAGFTSDGNVDVGSDGFLISVMSQLNPEENPGQDNDFLGNVISLESSPNAQGFGIADYTQFKAAGICAPVMDSGAASFQSGVVSVDPNVYPQLKNIARRRIADFIQDSMAQLAKGSSKKLNKKSRRDAIASTYRQFLRDLVSANNPDAQRIAGFTIDKINGNTGTTLALGLYRIIVAVRNLSSLDSIVLQTTVGEGVQVQELAPGEIQ